MKAIVFFDEFQRMIAEKKETAQLTYYNNKAFTKFITKEINRMLSKDNCKKQNEYFRIDAIQWTAKADLVNKSEGVYLNSHLWDLEIAVEHENNPKDWMDEVVKLAHIVCPLRVVIGYMPRDKRNEDQNYLDHVSKWMKELKCKDNMHRGEFLIILGNSKTDGNPEYFFNYKGYLFNPEIFRFEPIA